MRSPSVFTTAASATLMLMVSSLVACGGSAPAVAVATPAVVAYAADLKAVSSKKQVIHSADPAKCFDVKGDNASQHALVRLSGCHGRENQRWDFGPGAGGAVQVGGIGGLCLTAMLAPAPDGTSTEILTCNGTPSQEFKFYVDGRIQELQTNKCLTLGGGNGSGIMLLPCDAANAGQVWTLAGN